MINIKRKTGVYDVLYFMLLLYAFSTITQSLYPVSLNRIWTVGIIGCLLYELLFRFYKKTFVCMAATVICTIMTTLSAENVSRNINDLIYFVTGVLWLLFMTRNENKERLYDAFLENQRFTKIILMACYMSILVSLLSGNGYAYKWGSVYYVGFAGTQHTMASSLCMVTALFLLYSISRKFSWFHLAVFMFGVYAVFETGARTFIIPVLILLVYYIRHNIKSINVKAVVYAVGLMGILYVVQHSSMLDKFSFVFSGGNMAATMLEGFTSGRSSFWAVDLKAFADGSIFYIFFGRGFDYVYELNAQMVNQRIWAHNDFIHLLLGGGVTAFCLYVYVIYDFFRRLLRSKRTFDKMMFVVYLLFPALINGFFMYQHLLLSMMILCVCSFGMEKKKAYSKINFGERSNGTKGSERYRSCI